MGSELAELTELFWQQSTQWDTQNAQLVTLIQDSLAKQTKMMEEMFKLKSKDLAKRFQEQNVRVDNALTLGQGPRDTHENVLQNPQSYERQPHDPVLRASNMTPPITQQNPFEHIPSCVVPPHSPKRPDDTMHKQGPVPNGTPPQSPVHKYHTSSNKKVVTAASLNKDAWRRSDV